MWLIEIKRVPDAVFAESVRPVTPDKVRGLQATAVKSFAIGKGKELYACVGLMSEGLLAQHAVAWIVMLRGRTITLSDLRASKVLVQAFAKLHSFRLFADIAPGDVEGAKFARFCGFTPTGITGKFDVYRQVA